MRVSVDEAGEQRRIAKIDDARARGRRRRPDRGLPALTDEERARAALLLGERG